MAKITQLKSSVVAWWDLSESSGNLVDSHAGKILIPSPNVTASYYSATPGGGSTDLGVNSFSDGWFYNNDLKFRMPNTDFTVMAWVGAVAITGVVDNYWFVGKSSQVDMVTPQEVHDFAIMYRAGTGTSEIYVFVADALNDGGLARTITAPAVAPFWVPVMIRFWKKKNLYAVSTQTDFVNRISVSRHPVGNRVRGDYDIHSWPLTLLAADYQGAGETGHEMSIFSLAVFNKALSWSEAEWLYNSNAGRQYDDLEDEAVAEDECEEYIECTDEDSFAYTSSDATTNEDDCGEAIECCDDSLFDYEAESTVTSSAKDFLGIPPPGTVACEEDPEIFTIPENGACAQFPLTVSLQCETLNVQLYYTTDGSDPEDSETGTTLLYDSPITISDPNKVLKVRPVVDGCPAYDYSSFSWHACTTFDLTWLCTTTDKVGKWDEWAPNGRDDHNWTLKLQLGVSTTVLRIEMYELDEDMQWTTGQVWSTQRRIYPFPQAPDQPFDVYPLLVENSGAALNTDYSEELASAVSGAVDWDLYGDIEIATPVNHYYRAKIYTVEYGLIEVITPSDVCDIPPVITTPVVLVVAADCSSCEAAVNWSFTLPLGDGGGTYTITRSRRCIESDSEVIATGTGVAGVTSGTDTPLPPFCEVRYNLQYIYLSGEISNYQTVAYTTGCPTVSIDADLTDVEVGETVTFSINSNLHGGGACAANIQLYDNGGAWTTVSPNTLVSLPINSLTAGTHVIMAEACNACGTDTDSVTVVVTEQASCDGSTTGALVVTQVRASGSSAFYPMPAAGVQLCTGFPESGAVPWDGTISTYRSTCYWENPTQLYYLVRDGSGFQLWIKARVDFQTTANGWAKDVYVLRVFCSDAGGLLWVGTKAYGSSPVGDYTLVGSYPPTGEIPKFTNPSTLSIEMM